MYRKIGKIGEGGFGSVFLAENGNGNVAIKQYKNLSNGISPEILRELSMLSYVSHKNIVKIFHITCNVDRIEIIMEYGGINIRRHMETHKYDVRVSMVRPIFEQVLYGLNYLHELGLGHRDLKLDNILISSDNHVRLCDFGVAKKFYNNIHTPSVGTPGYRAPEILASTNYNHMVDMWSLGCIMYEYIMKNRLFKGNSDIVVLTKILKTVPVVQEDLDFLGLKIFSITECNNEEYFKITSLYTDKLCNVETRTFLDKIKNIIEKMLSLNPTKRITASSAILCIAENIHCISDIQNIAENIQCISDNTNHSNYVVKKFVSYSRYIYCDIILNMIKKFNLSHQTIILAIDILDHFISVYDKMSKAINELHIIAIVVVIIASKQLELKYIRYNNFPHLDYDNLYHWETTIIRTIDFKIIRPTIYDMLIELNININQQWNAISHILLDYNNICGLDWDNMIEKLRFLNLS